MSTIFSSVTHLDSVDSTNTWLFERKIPAPAVVYTFNQTNGRGRENRVWHDFAGKNLALSVSFEPAVTEIPLWRIAVLSIPAAEFLMHLGIPDVWIKWPNDIFSAEKKIAGVLAESEFSGGKISKIVAGIGINVNLDKSDISSINKKATSVYAETGRIHDMNDFVRNFLPRLESSVSRSSDIGWIRERWCALSRMIGRDFEWETADGIIPGRVKALNEDGTLNFETGNGCVTVSAGDISLKMP